eukprot:TRINITY_DN3593_c0_g1_i3.p1 TRINITY_DN3593_c0_g1~~TRINITY_DN3593_c0_g1_i3.p1  ORF type:complete len:127 (+),score=60.20 TRINITY_DN3593_c0_g1_i3:38-418(+)
MIEVILYLFFFFQAEDGIRDAQESRGLGDVYKRQYQYSSTSMRLTKDVHPVKYLCLIPYPVTPLYVSQSVPVSCQFLITFETTFLFKALYTALASTSVSYTHLTLPTIYSVQISVVAVSFKKKYRL